MDSEIVYFIYHNNVVMRVKCWCYSLITRDEVCVRWGGFPTWQFMIPYRSQMIIITITINIVINVIHSLIYLEMSLYEALNGMQCCIWIFLIVIMYFLEVIEAGIEEGFVILSTNIVVFIWAREVDVLIYPLYWR